MNFIKNNLQTIIIFFCIGFIINNIPRTINTLERKKYERIKLLEKNFLRHQKEEICRKKSKYSKFLEMGFKETAQKRLISCMKQ